MTPIRRPLRQWRRLPLISPRLWVRRVIFWGGAMLVSVMSIALARGADMAQGVFNWMLDGHQALAFVICPAGLAICVYLTRRFFPGSQGSGIPQAMAALHLHDPRQIDGLLSMRIAIGKFFLTLLGFVAGASIGREGPTVQVGSSILYAVGRALRLPREETLRALILAGGAAGIAGAFNTPLAGVVFAIEEMSHSFESRTSGTVLTAVIIGGATTLVLAGNYTYFGSTSALLTVATGWLPVLACAVVAGMLGGLFSRILIDVPARLPARFGRILMHRPILFAALCGLLIALIGWAAGGQTFGAGYGQARGMVEGHGLMPPAYPLLKLLATAISYLSGIPGGIFAPSLSVGAGIAAWFAPLFPAVPPAALVLLTMVSYFSGVVQAPITAAVIVMEMTNNQQMVVPLMAASAIAFVASRLVCRRPLYAVLAGRFLRVMDHGTTHE